MLINAVPYVRVYPCVYWRSVEMYLFLLSCPRITLFLCPEYLLWWASWSLSGAGNPQLGTCLILPLFCLSCCQAPGRISFGKGCKRRKGRETPTLRGTLNINFPSVSMHLSRLLHGTSFAYPQPQSLVPDPYLAPLVSYPQPMLTLVLLFWCLSFISSSTLKPPRSVTDQSLPPL